jgi:hypothetical protein
MQLTPTSQIVTGDAKGDLYLRRIARTLLYLNLAFFRNWPIVSFCLGAAWHSPSPSRTNHRLTRVHPSKVTVPRRGLTVTVGGVFSYASFEGIA